MVDIIMKRFWRSILLCLLIVNLWISLIPDSYYVMSDSAPQLEDLKIVAVYGDLIVHNDTSVENTLLVVYGDIIIDEGKLDLINSSLVLVPSDDVSYLIVNNGSLNIYMSSVTAFTGGIVASVFSDGSMRIINSTIENIGFSERNLCGILVYGKLVVRSSKLSGEYCLVRLNNASTVTIFNTMMICWGDYAVMVESSKNVSIIKNYIESDLLGVYISKR